MTQQEESKEDSRWDPCAESLPHAAEATYLRQTFPINAALAWGEEIAPPVRNPLTPPYGLGWAVVYSLRLIK